MCMIRLACFLAALAACTFGDHPSDHPADARGDTCGDGVLDQGEDCDDGNTNATDACRECKWARCGDGEVRTGVEECDDGNTSDEDACNASCLSCVGGNARGTWAGNHHCYTRYDFNEDWATARASCVAKGGELTAIGSAEEDAFVRALLGPTSRMWIGLNSVIDPGAWRWSTNEPVPYAGWLTGQPDNNGGNEHCVEFFGAAWNDAGCTFTSSYVCENAGWVIRPEDAHAYLFTYLTVDWDDARARCAAFGGHLATLTSAGELAFVTGLAHADLWLGGSDSALEGTFTWITGEPFTYTAWSAGEPNDEFGEDCLTLRIGEMNDVDCEFSLGYVCEID